MQLAQLLVVVVVAVVVAGASGVKQPHIILMVADDLGWADVPWHDALTIAPTLTGLANTGIILERHYTQSICTPTRSALMTGKYPSRLGLNHMTIYAGQPYGLQVNETIIAHYMSEAGYAVHGAGKWHLGYCSWDMTPVARGFDSFYGYYNGHEDYYTKMKSNGFDFRYDTKGADGTVNSEVLWEANGTYSTYQYSDHVAKVIADHDKSQPFFLYHPIQSVHSPLEVPQKYRDMYDGIVEDEQRASLLAMVTALDDDAEVLVSALKKAGMWEDTIFIFFSDNGGPIGGISIGQVNYPLRGGKYSYWEGGIRSASFLHSPLLPGGRINTELFHVTDWLPTLTHIANCGIEENPGCTGPELGDIDGVNQWPAVAGLAPSNRTEFLVNIDPVKKNAALRMGPWKLLQGNPGNGAWPVPPRLDRDDESQLTDEEKRDEYDDDDEDYDAYDYDELEQMELLEGKIQLYNVEYDPSETQEVSKLYPEIVNSLLERLQYHKDRSVPPRNAPVDPASNPSHFDGAWTPWRDTC